MVTRSSNVTKYIGPRPAMTETDTERLRRSLPDDPIELPPGHLACEGCGIAHEGEVVDAVPAGFDHRQVAQFTRCPDCQDLHDRAGGDRAVRNALYALAVIGVEPPEDPTPLVAWLQVAGSGVWWLNPDAPSRTYCSPHPWAHVTLRQRAAVREAYLLAMRNRVRLGAPALNIPPPWGRACLFCGIGSLPMPPLDVVRRGGRESAAHAIWRRVVAQPTSFGGHGPEVVDGFLCPPCSEAVDSVAAVGVRARARAFEQHVRAHRSEQEADRVRSLLDQYDYAIRLPGWAALAAEPSREPWAHIVVPEPEPVTL